ncbi:MAG TPA: PAS domain S-box protein [Marinagarivorans sp.]
MVNRWLQRIAELAGAACLFAFCIYWSLTLAPAASYQSVFWPLAGVALAALLTRGFWHLLPLLLASAFVYLLYYDFNSTWQGILLSVTLIALPALQAGLGCRLIQRYCDKDLWVFADARKLLQLILAGGLLPAALTSVLLTLVLQLYAQLDLTASVDIALSLAFGNACSVAIITPCLLLVYLSSPLISAYRKIRIVIPIAGLFAVAALCYGALYHQLRSQLELQHQTRLDSNTEALKQRVNAVHQQLQTLRFFLMAEQGNVAERYKAAARKAMAAHQAIEHDPPYFATALLTATYSDRGEINNYVLEHIYPTAAFPIIKGLPLANEDMSLRVLLAAAARVEVRTLPNLDLARTTAGSFVSILLHQLFPDDPALLLAAAVDVSNLGYKIGAQYMKGYHAFRIEDILSGRVLYQSGGRELFANNTNLRYRQLLEFGDRAWRLTAVYDAVWLEYRLQKQLLYISILSLLLIAVFTLLILSALVSAQSLEHAVDLRSKELDEERRFLDAIFESLPLFVVVKDAYTRKYVRVNRYAERVLGAPRTYFEGKTAYDLFSKEEASRRTATDIQALNTRGPLEVGEESIHTPTGLRWLYTHKTVIQDNHGEPRFILGISEDITDRRSQDETLDGLIESLPLSLLVVAEDGVIVYANHSTHKLVVLTQAQTSLKDVLPDCDFAMIRSLLSECGESARPITVIAKVCNVQDVWVPVEVVFKCTRWKGENRFLVLISDISDRVGAQKMLRDSENQLRLLMANLGEGVCGVDPMGNITYANLAACELLDYDLTSIQNANFYQSIFSASNEGGDPIFKACSLGQITRSSSALFTTRHGHDIPVDFVCTPLLSDDDRNLGAVVVFSNIQERLEYEESLMRRNELIALGLDASGLGSWEWQLSDNRLVWSANVYKILGMQEGSFSGRPEDISSIIHPHDLADVRLVDEHARQHLEVTDFCCRCVKLSGEVIWVTGKYRYFADKAGKVVRARGVLWDSTEETLLQRDNAEKTEALKRSNKELDDFAHIASHDLKEPLRGISNYATFLQEDYDVKLDAEGKEMLQSITRLTGHMERLISDLLNYSRLGRTELAYGQVDIDSLITQVIESLLPRLEQLNVELSYLSPMAAIYCDRVRMKEVFRNLISNAMKYSCSDNKRVELGCEVNQTETIFYVADNGIGIPKEYHDKVFDVFKRLHGNSEFGGGSGIGLSIVQKVIGQHNGRLWFESEEGVGSTFYFSVPHRPS